METIKNDVPRSRGGRPPGLAAIKSNAMKQVREKLGLTQQELAQELGCALSTVTKNEARGTLPAQKALLTAFEKLARRAGVSIDAAASA
jgi:transcriptional regulator with XRE-family HTH domain